MEKQELIDALTSISVEAHNIPHWILEKVHNMAYEIAVDDHEIHLYDAFALYSLCVIYDELRKHNEAKIEKDAMDAENDDFDPSSIDFDVDSPSRSDSGSGGSEDVSQEDVGCSEDLDRTDDGSGTGMDPTEDDREDDDDQSGSEDSSVDDAGDDGVSSGESSDVQASESASDSSSVNASSS
eukprot:ANDGO_03701.mRNA.2 hypothetical protein